jgi:hypothetical protein
MGRLYSFECSKCGYRARVSGRADRGLNLFVQTIACLDCKELYDAVTRLRIPDGDGDRPKSAAQRRSDGPTRAWTPDRPPRFELALNRLLYFGVREAKWLQFKTQCPVSPLHRVQNWNAPEKCPKCGLFLERTTLPYRIWD